MREKPWSKTKVESDRVVAQRGAVYHGGIMKASGGTATVNVYDGLNATTGLLIDSFSATNGNFERNAYERGIDIVESLFVDIGNNVSPFVVFYEPPSGDEL